MLQIIGWLGCTYLLVKAFELLAQPAYRDESGNIAGPALIACALAALAALGFGLWIYEQGVAVDRHRTGDELRESITAQCIELAKTPEAASECVK